MCLLCPLAHKELPEGGDCVLFIFVTPHTQHGIWATNMHSEFLLSEFLWSKTKCLGLELPLDTLF